MASIEILKARFQPVLDEFLSSEPVQWLLTERMTPAEYRTILREVFHHTRENPQLQVLASVHFRGRQRDMVRPFFTHATSEIGHDQLALNDFKALGGDARWVAYRNPLPATSALLAYGFYQVYNLNPLGYLGYLFFLEFTPTQTGAGMIERLEAIGVGEHARTFLRDHSRIDHGHNRLMAKYVEHLATRDADLDCITYAMRATGQLYARMMMQAIEDARMPGDYGWNWEELDADGVTPQVLGPATS